MIFVAPFDENSAKNLHSPLFYGIIFSLKINNLTYQEWLRDWLDDARQPILGQGANS